MQAGAECHAGVEMDDSIPRSLLVFSPGGPNDERRADPEDLEVLLPGVRPILFFALGEGRISDTTDLLEVPECVLELAAASR